MLKHEELTEAILGAAIEVHREFGPGLLESAYEAALVIELEDRGLAVQRQVQFQTFYKGKNTGQVYRIDLLVNDLVIIEVKSVNDLLPVMDAQILTYMKLAKKPVGLLINFNNVLLKQGVKRFVR